MFTGKKENKSVVEHIREIYENIISLFAIPIIRDPEDDIFPGVTILFQDIAVYRLKKLKINPVIDDSNGILRER